MPQDPSIGAISSLLSIANNLSVVGLLLVIIWGGKKRWWVFGWQYDQAIRDAAEWKRIAFNSLGVTQRGITAAEKVLNPDMRSEDDPVALPGRRRREDDDT